MVVMYNISLRFFTSGCRSNGSFLGLIVGVALIHENTFGISSMPFLLPITKCVLHTRLFVIMGASGLQILYNHFFNNFLAAYKTSNLYMLSWLMC